MVLFQGSIVFVLMDVITFDSRVYFKFLILFEKKETRLLWCYDATEQYFFIFFLILHSLNWQTVILLDDG